MEAVQFRLNLLKQVSKAMPYKENPSNSSDTLPHGVAKRLFWLLILATVLLLIGWGAPMLTISQFVIVRNSFSVVSGIFELYKHGQIVLFAVITLFSIILPLVKLWLLFRILIHRERHSATVGRYLKLMHDYGRWSMLDVLVVALLVVMVKLGSIATVQVHYGLYVFGAAVLLIMYVTHQVVTLTLSD